MSPHEQIAFRARLRWVCECACGFRRQCTDKDDAERTAARHTSIKNCAPVVKQRK